MKLDKLQYQLDAVYAAANSVSANNVTIDENAYANPVLINTRAIDVKMETGTGKTYVYTRLMHQLKQQFGFFKFIIIVPSVAIKEGAKMSIKSSSWRSHFRQEFANQNINLGLINAGDFESKKGKRKQFPESLRTFCEGTRNEDKTIQVLLMNDAMLGSKSMAANDYDGTLFGSVSSPIEGLQSTRPIVIIDEPHRFNKENKAWRNITEGLQPQLIIRFGATFPEITVGTGKNKIIKKDYDNLVYDLNAVRAFNEGLVKGVHIVYPAIPGGVDSIEKFRVKEIDKTNKLVVFSKNNKNYEVKIGDSLTLLHQGFHGITLEGIASATSALLSNDLELKEGLDLLPNIYDYGYQELLLNQAIDEHFVKEEENFYRPSVNNNPPRIKTNSLFFIDSVASFRGENNEKGWLREKFEKLLENKLNALIPKAKGEYKEFLNASLQNLSKTIAGYFAEDNSKKGDEAIQEEVDNILRNKEQMLRFKNDDGTWNVCRFLFSKWALREGWDNPNVFVIAKLRTSGSEISKIQEVGRGLRLPFDENGTRQSQQTGEDFRLTYIIDFSERDFAKKLIGDINADGGKLAEGKITDQLLDIILSKKSAYSEETLKSDNIISEAGKIEDQEKFEQLLPENTQATKDILELLKESGYADSEEDVKIKLLVDKVIDVNDVVTNKSKFAGIIKDKVEITNTTIEKLIPAKFAENKEEAKVKLLQEGVIDSNDNIINQDKFLTLLPEKSGVSVKKGVITTGQEPKRPTVKLNKSNFEKLRSLWNEVTKRYALHFEKVDETELKSALLEVLKDNVFIKPEVQIVSEFLVTNQNSANIVEGGYQSAGTSLGVLPYGEFLKRLNKRTHLPLNLLNQSIIEARNGVPTPQELFNVITIEKIVDGFDKKFIELYAQRYSYSPLDYKASTSIFKDVNGKMEFVDELPQGDVGNIVANDILRKETNYLYDKYVFDSEIEHEVLKVNPPSSVLVYGKLPRRSIKLPTYTGGTTSPDFVYAIKKDEQTLQLHLVVETKSDNPRMSDTIAVNSQKEAFKNIQNIEWRLSTKVEDFVRDLTELTTP
jgi:restriction endonuclease